MAGAFLHSSVHSGFSPALALAGAAALVVIAVLTIACACVVLRNFAPCSASYDDDDDDDDDYDDDEADDAAAMLAAEREHGDPPQNILIEVGGRVVGSVQCRTGRCRSLRELRRRVCAQARHLTGGASDRALTLEYLDEGAGLAILVADEGQLDLVLSMPTLKATFASKSKGMGARALGGRSLGRSAKPMRGGGRRERTRGGYARTRGDDVDEDDDDYHEPKSACVMQ